MANPFPGMNPYLESPELWRSVHNRLIVAIADWLTPQLLPKYLVDIEQRIYQNQWRRCFTNWHSRCHNTAHTDSKNRN